MTEDRSIAIITPSYAADYERCCLLADSIDAHVSGISDHYILVDADDFSLFSSLDGPNRHIINERDILPDWLHNIRGGFGPSARKIWYSTKTWPMRGWHVQQLRRIAIAHHIHHDALLYCDSDMFFVRPFDGKSLWKDNNLRLFRKPNGIAANLEEHQKWLHASYQILGLGSPELPHHDYINNLVSWRRDKVLDMCTHIENTTGRDWVSSIGRNRTFSECMIYGCYVDNVLGERSGHWMAENGLCLTYWDGAALDQNTLQQFVEQMDDGQFAVGIQSFTNTDPELLRSLI